MRQDILAQTHNSIYSLLSASLFFFCYFNNTRFWKVSDETIVGTFVDEIVKITPYEHPLIASANHLCYIFRGMAK